MKFKTLYVSLMLFVTLFSYQNCSLVSSSHTDDLSSTLGTGCLAPVQNLFMNTYYPHVRTNCTSCHDKGGTGMGYFASSDPQEAFTAFTSAGRSKIDMMMVNDSHTGPNNGPGMQPFLNSVKTRWDAVEAATASCASGNEVITAAKNTTVAASATVPLATIPNSDPNKRPWRVLEWDLFRDVANPTLAGKLHLVMRLQYREAQSGTQDIGYEFTRPSARIRAGAPADTAYAIDKITIYRNGQKLDSATAFLAIDNFVVGTGTDTLMLASGATPGIVSMDAGGVAIKNLATDVFALRIAEIRNANGQPVSTDPSAGGGGGTTTPLPATITYAMLMDTNNTYGYFARSCVRCHNAGNAAGGLNLEVYAQAMVVASSIKNRVNNAARPMPTAGLLPQYSRDVISLWVDRNAPQ